MKAALFRDVGMAGGQAIAAGMEDQGLAVRIFVILYLAQKNHVIAAVVLADVAANKVSVRAAEQGHAGETFNKFNSGKFIGQRGRKLTGKVVLAGGQHIYREVSGVGEVGKAGGLPRQAPQHEGWLQRH